jgi:hypothetical protein
LRSEASVDQRVRPFTERKARIARLLARQPDSIVVNDHAEADWAARICFCVLYERPYVGASNQMMHPELR